MEQSSDIALTFITKPSMRSHCGRVTVTMPTPHPGIQVVMTKHQHSVGHDQENHFHHENVTVSQMLDDFMLVEVRCPVLRLPRGHEHNKAQMKNDRVTLTGNKRLTEMLK